MTTLLLAGATGLVGQAVLTQCLCDPRIMQVVAPTRRALPAHPRLLNPIVDFSALPEDAAWWKADAVICTLGTTIRQAGSKEAFRQVDHHYPLALATLAQRHGTPTFALTSAMGADPSQAFPGQDQKKPEQAEIERLRKEVTKLKAERDILKKAAAYFAKDQA